VKKQIRQSRPRVDLTNKKFGRLTPQYYIKGGKWHCICDCGKELDIDTRNLNSGHTQSCGCLRDAEAKRAGKNKKYNKYDLSGEYGIGWTSDGEEFYFDIEDYEKIKDYCWYIDRCGYVASSSGVLMHRIVLPTENGFVPDHIHGKNTNNDNRKCNLRVATDSQNHMNMRKSSRNTSGVTGVSKHNDGWVAHIKAGEITRQKYFKNKEDAIKQRKEWEELYFREYSFANSQKLNI
jgi:hypothetical protein